jgi:hypothetical protein
LPELKSSVESSTGKSREVYWYMGLYEFDVDRARELVQDGREAVEVDEESVRASVDGSEINRSHVARVDPTIPGIIAHVRYRTDEGRVFQGHVLIDGHHRAARCLAEKRPFEAFLLTPEESEAVLLRRPDDPIPPLCGKLREQAGRFTLTTAGVGMPVELDERAFFLLGSADGTKTPSQIRAAYKDYFGTPLAQEEFNVFIKRAQSNGWIQLTLPCRT